MVAMRKCNNLKALLLSMNTNEAMIPLLELTSFGKQAHHCTFGHNFLSSTGRVEFLTMFALQINSCKK